MPASGREVEALAATTSVSAHSVSPTSTGCGKAISENPRLATVVPSVVSCTVMPTSRDNVSIEFTSRSPNSLSAANSASRCNGWGFMVRQLKNVLSASVTVLVTAWSTTRPGSRSSNHFPLMARRTSFSWVGAARQRRVSGWDRSSVGSGSVWARAQA